MLVEFGDVYNDLMQGADARRLFRWWENKFPEEMRRFVKEHVSRVLYDIFPENIIETSHKSQHALGNLRKEQDIYETQNVKTDYALEYVFHGILEQCGLLPWQDYYAVFCDSNWRDVWYQPALDSVMTIRNDIQAAEAGLQWRIGNAWQSSIRELHLISSLYHRYGLPVKYHILADVLFRLDCWIGNRGIYLRVPNAFENRKIQPEELFPYPFVIFKAEIPHQGRGKIWFTEPEKIDEIAEWILVN